MFSIYLVIGAFAGAMSGLFGIGGGLIIIPALSAIFLHHAQIPQDQIMQVAVGTSLATVIITASVAMYSHNKRNAVIWGQVRLMVPSLIVGVIIGSIIARFLSTNFLRDFFALFLLVISARFWIREKDFSTMISLSPTAIRITSLFIGILSSILGVGGGVILVPFLLRCKLDIREATGTSVTCGIAIAIVATLCFMATGWLAGIHLPESTGYIYWPAFLGIATASILFAPFGAALAHHLPRKILKRIFSLFLLVIAIDMLFFSR